MVVWLRGWIKVYVWIGTAWGSVSCVAVLGDTYVNKWRLSDFHWGAQRQIDYSGGRKNKYVSTLDLM